MRALGLLLLSTSLGLLGCGGSGSGDDTSGGPDASAADALPQGYTELIGRDWTIDPGETYKCIRIRVDHDMLINSFHAVAPVGTHHTVLTVSSSSSPLGEYDCAAGNLDLQMLFASGVGTDDLTFPDGVAMRVTAGQYINLNLHLFNTQPSGSLTGHSAIAIKTIDPSQLTDEAEMVFAGTGNISIPGGSTDQNPAHAVGGCTFTRDATLLAYWPHMHQHAVHQKVTITPSGGSPIVVHDADYEFTNQKNYPLSPTMQVHNGDAISVDCSYTNPDPSAPTITFGDSSLDEMCFTGLYRYPKQALYLFECTTGIGP